MNMKEIAQLAGVTAANVRVVVDLSDYRNTTGTFSINAKIYVDGYPDVGAVGEHPVTVTIPGS